MPTHYKILKNSYKVLQENLIQLSKKIIIQNIRPIIQKIVLHNFFKNCNLSYS